MATKRKAKNVTKKAAKKAAPKAAPKKASKSKGIAKARGVRSVKVGNRTLKVGSRRKGGTVVGIKRTRAGTAVTTKNKAGARATEYV